MTFPGYPARGPGARALPAESIGRVSPFPRSSARHPQKAAGHWATYRVAPTENQPEDLVMALCPPVPWNQSCLMISAGNALAPGPDSKPKFSGFEIRISDLIPFRISQRVLRWVISSRMAAQRRGNMISWWPVRWNPRPPARVGRRTTLVRGR